MYGMWAAVKPVRSQAVFTVVYFFCLPCPLTDYPIFPLYCASTASVAPLAALGSIGSALVNSKQNGGVLCCAWKKQKSVW